MFFRAKSTRLAAMRTLRHENILTYAVQDFEHGANVTMQRPRETLLNVIQSTPKGNLDETRSRKYFLQLLSALVYMHAMGFVHKDVKPENVYYDRANDRCLLGAERTIRRIPRDARLKDNVGSLHYAAPEIMFERPYRGPEADVWALGVTLYVMTTGYFPFSGSTPDELRANIGRPLEILPGMSKHLCELLSGMFTRDADSRTTLFHAANSFWSCISSQSK